MSMSSLPPQNLEAEQGVLGSVLIDPSTLHEAVQVLRASDFFRDIHGVIWTAIVELYDQGLPVDVVTVSEELSRANKLESVGGFNAVASFAESVPHTVNALYWAQIVRQKSLARRLIMAGEETLKESYSNNHSAEELLSRAERRLFEIAMDQGRATARDGAALAKAAWDRMERRHAGEVTGIRTGFPVLDRLTEGLRPAALYILAARPSQGKTSLAMNVCETVVFKQGGAALFISLEMDYEELSDRLLSSQSGVSAKKIKTPRLLSQEETKSLEQAYEQISGCRLIVEDDPRRSMSQIAASTRFHRAKNDIALVVIDYLSLIDGQARKGESRQEEVARVSRQLKALAREVKLPLLVLHQLNRNSENREDRRPRLADLRESGQIEQDADVVMLLHRPDFYDKDDRPGQADVLVAKNRTGATGPVRLAFIDELTRFGTLATNYPEPDDEWSERTP
jgi:replicative DNA helicase